MGNIRLFASSLFALTTLVACGDDGGTPMIVDSMTIVDAPPVDNAPPIDQPMVTYDFSCFGNSPPAVATTVMIAGTAQEVYLNGIQPGVRAADMTSIKACTGDCQGPNELDVLPMTGATGEFMTDTIATNEAAIDGYLSATRAGDLPTLLFPHAPLSESLAGAPLLMIQSSLLQALTFAGLPEQDPANGVVAIAVTDCSATLQGVSGAIVSLTQGGSPVGDDPLDAGQFDEMAAGVYVITNVPPGTVIASAMYGSQGFLMNDMTVVAGTVTTAQVRPGY